MFYVVEKFVEAREKKCQEVEASFAGRADHLNERVNIQVGTLYPMFSQQYEMEDDMKGRKKRNRGRDRQRTCTDHFLRSGLLINSAWVDLAVRIRCEQCSIDNWGSNEWKTKFLLSKNAAYLLFPQNKILFFFKPVLYQLVFAVSLLLLLPLLPSPLHLPSPIKIWKIHIGRFTDMSSTISVAKFQNKPPSTDDGSEVDIFNDKDTTDSVQVKQQMK